MFHKEKHLGVNKKKNQFSLVMERLSKNKMAMIGLIVIALEIVIAIAAPYIIPYDVAKIDPQNRFAPISWAHPFGTDDMGRDLFSRVIYGSRYSLSIGIVSVFLAMILGMFIGAVAGYFGGKIDNVIMRILDIVQSIPWLLLTIVITAAMGGGIIVTIMALAIASIPGNARLFRASILSVRTQEYIEAAHSICCPTPRLILDHIVPNAISPMIVNTTMSISTCIISAASLSFLGLGIQPPTPEWGALLVAGRESMRMHPSLVVIPGVAIMITVFALNVLGDGLRNAMDPKLKD